MRKTSSRLRSGSLSLYTHIEVGGRGGTSEGVASGAHDFGRGREGRDLDVQAVLFVCGVCISLGVST